MSAASVLIHVQHLLGIGHFMRVREISAALAASGFDVHLVSGGMPVASGAPPGVRLVQLPPIRVADATFRPLLDAALEPVDDAYRERRRALLLQAFEAAAPAAVLTETFPFGRRALRFELLPLIERIRAMRPRPLLVSTIRDVLQRQPPERERQMLSLAHEAYDAVLVHADPRFVRFEDSFSREAPLALAPALHYTGFVAADAAPAASSVRDEIVVSAGGGAVGSALVECAIAARARSRHRDRPWRILVGENVPGPELARLKGIASEGTIVERARDDFRSLLRRAIVSVSQAGYNTVLDVMRSGAGAVLVPFSAGGQTEQPMRAQRLAALGIAVAVDEAALGPASLAHAIDEAAAQAGSSRFDFDADGARRSAAIVADLLAAHERRSERRAGVQR